MLERLISPQSIAGGPRAERLADEPCVAVTGNFSRARLVRAGIAERITIAEASALQGFPLDFVWCGTKTSQFQQLGNAIPPPMAAAFVTALLDA